MARKENSESKPERGFGEVWGFILLGTAILLLLSLFSFDRYDLSFIKVPPNQPIHNGAGNVGAYLGYAFFFTFGVAAYIWPFLLIGFALANWTQVFSYLKRQWIWAAILMICCMGMFDLYTDKELVARLLKNPNLPATGFLERLSLNINAPSGGGFVGLTLNNYLFGHFGKAGATIVFSVLYLVSLIFLTNFHVLDWLKSFKTSEQETEGLSAEEKALEKRARDLEKQARKLQDEVEKNGKGEKAGKKAKAEPVEALADEEKTGLGADLQPVPEPTVRDLSVPPPRIIETPAKKGKGKPEPDPAEPLLEGEVISARELEAATTADILGKDSGSKKKKDKDKNGEEATVIDPDAPPFDVDPAVPSAEPAVALAADAATSAEPPPTGAAPEPLPAVPPAPVRTKPLPRKPKPITVAATPMIGNYKLPPMDFLQYADQNVKPTESREELMANAQLMKNTLAQFDIEVSTRRHHQGPHHHALRVASRAGREVWKKFPRSTNNIAAALKAERIHILAPVPGKSVRRHRSARTSSRPRSSCATCWSRTSGRTPRHASRSLWARMFMATRSSPTSRKCRTCSSLAATGSGKSVCINSIVASLLYKFSPDQLRFVMIDPKVVELQQYNALPHLVVPVVTDPKKVILALRWVVNEMEKRYQIFAKRRRAQHRLVQRTPERQAAARNPEPELPLTARRRKNRAGSRMVLPSNWTRRSWCRATRTSSFPEKLSYIVVIIDELADLMLVAPADVEMAIARITQMARAAGIHCIVATQRPSVDVITGVIKANIPARIAFQVASRRGLTHHSRCDGREQTARQGRHALPAPRLGQAQSRPGRADHRPGNPERGRFHRRPGQAKLRTGNPQAALQAQRAGKRGERL